jgi:hypothetical protein
MKNLIKIILAVLIYHSALSAYGGPPPPPLYNARNNGSIYQPQINLASNNQMIIFTKFTYTAVSTIKGKIDLDGTETDPAGIVNGKNFEWGIPKTAYTIGIAPPLSETTSLLISINGENNGVKSFDLGLNFLFLNNENHFARLGLGLNIHERNFIWVQKPGENYFVEKKDNGPEYDPFINLTYNTNFDNWIFNPFIQFSYCKQTLLDNDDYSSAEGDREVYSNIDVFTITPGLSYKPSRKILISFGSYINNIQGIDNMRNPVVTPFMQLNFLF